MCIIIWCVLHVWRNKTIVILECYTNTSVDECRFFESKRLPKHCLRPGGISYLNHTGKVTTIVTPNGKVRTVWWVLLPRDAAMLARSYSASRNSVRPSVLLSAHACFVTKPNTILRIFWYHTKGQSLFMTLTVVGRRRPLPPDICAQIPVGADLCFTWDSFYFLSFFSRLISELAERNSTKIGHMLGDNCDLRTHVQNLGVLSSYKSGAQNHLFGWLRNLKAILTAYIFGTKRDINNQSSALTTTRGLKMSWTLVHKRLQTRLHFYPPSVNSAFYFIARLRRRRSANRTQPNFDKRWTVGGVVSLEKIGAKELLHLFGFSTTSRLNGEYLLKETWYRQSDNGVGKYESSPTLSKNFTDFCPQTP